MRYVKYIFEKAAVDRLTMSMLCRTYLTKKEQATRHRTDPGAFKKVQLAGVNVNLLNVDALTCRADNGKVRKPHIVERSDALIPLTRNGQKWVAYVFDPMASGTRPGADGIQYLHRVVKSDHCILAFIVDREVTGEPRVLWKLNSKNATLSAGLPVFETDAVYDATDAVAFVMHFGCWSARNSYESELVLPANQPWQDGPLLALSESDEPGSKTALQFLELKRNYYRCRIMLSFSKQESHDMWKAALSADPIKTANRISDLAIDWHGDHANRRAEGDSFA